MQYDPNRPIWLQVKGALATDIATGKRPAGDKLPGGRELALTFEINPNTAARVYQELEREGLCETRRGLGTFVTTNEERIRQLKHEMAMDVIRQFLTGMAQLGISREEAIKIITEDTGNA